MSKWRTGFAAHGLAGLQDAPGWARRYDAEVQRRVLAALLTLVQTARRR